MQQWQMLGNNENAVEKIRRERSIFQGRKQGFIHQSTFNRCTWEQLNRCTWEH